MMLRLAYTEGARKTAASPELLVFAGQPGWDEARRAWNLAVDQRPAAVALPVALVAVTRTRSRRPTARAVMTYDCVVAPPIAAQSEASGFPPDSGQRVHWYAKEVGLFVHWPGAAVTVEPTRAVPETDGSLVLPGR